jgi:streptogramin lyase
MSTSKEAAMKRFSVIVVAAVAATAVTAVAVGASAKRVVIRTTPGGAPLHLSIGAGGVWVGTHRAYILYRINPRTNRKRAYPITQNTCGPPAFAYGYVFQSGCGDTWTSLQIDLRTGHILRHLAGINAFVGAGSLWLVRQDGKIARVDPRSGVPLATIDPGIDLTQNGVPVAVLDGSTWVAGDTAISRIDVQTNKVTQVIPLPGGKASGDYTGGYLYGGYGTVLNGKLWVTNPAGLYEVDPTTNTAILLPIRVKPLSQFGDLYVAAGAGSLWMRTSDTSVARIDPATASVVQRYPAAGGGGGIAFGYGSLWVSNAGADSIWRYAIH